MRLFDKFFSTNEYFTIALRNKSDSFENQEWKFFMLANKNRWFADPMIAEDNGKAYLFFEATEGMHGHIEVAEILENCSHGSFTRILSGEGHYSYPFVFDWDRVWYMIPESSGCSEVCLYKSTNFPYDWEKICDLLNKKAVDTTVLEYENKLFLLTYIVNGINEIVIPKAYELDLNNRKIVRELRWIEPNGLRSRGAGPIFSIENKKYRPAQINREHAYGDGIVIYEIKRCDSCYEEKEQREMSMVTTKIKGKIITGMHTYTSSNHFEAIDVRVRDIDYFKSIKRLFKIQ